jgi:hypothetical protein
MTNDFEKSLPYGGDFFWFNRKAPKFRGVKVLRSEREGFCHRLDRLDGFDFWLRRSFRYQMAFFLADAFFYMFLFSQVYCLFFIF